MQQVKAHPETKLITGEELLAMGDIGACELIDGRIVKMAPAGGEHGNLELNLAFVLKQFTRNQRIGRVMTGEVGIYIRRNPDRVRGADILLVSYKTLPKLTDKFLEVAPELIVEVMSPNDQWKEVRHKLDDYFSIGVEQVWVVEPRNRKIHVYRTLINVQEFSEGDTLVGEGILTGFQLEIADVFSE